MRTHHRGAVTYAGVLAACLAGCHHAARPQPASLQSEAPDFSSVPRTLSTYFRALENVDIDGVIACLAQPDDKDQAAAIDAMVEDCGFIVLKQGQYGEVAGEDIRTYLDDTVSGILPAQPIRITYDDNSARAVWKTNDGKGDGEAMIFLLRMGKELKIDAKSTFAAHYGARAVELDSDAAVAELESLRDLKERIDSGDFKHIEDAVQAVQSLGFDIVEDDSQ
jgi:hypothetical protein